jgi:hypothetical protein
MSGPSRLVSDPAANQNANPPAVSGGHGEIVISAWRPHRKNTVRGFFDATRPLGLVLHSLMLHERDGARWIAFPGREWSDAQGQRQFSPVVEFISRTIADRFRDQILAALNVHLVATRG